MTDTPRKVNAVAAARRAQAAALRAQADAIEAEADALDGEQVVDAPVPLDVAAQRTSTSEHTLRRWVLEGRLAASRGPRGKYLVRVSDVMTVLGAVAVVPRPRKAEAPADTLESWEAETEAELRRMGGGR